MAAMPTTTPAAMLVVDEPLGFATAEGVGCCEFASPGAVTVAVLDCVTT